MTRVLRTNSRQENSQSAGRPERIDGKDCGMVGGAVGMLRRGSGANETTSWPLMSWHPELLILSLCY